MKSGIFLLCLGALAPTQLFAVLLIIRNEIQKQSQFKKTDWVSVGMTAVMTFAMLSLPITMASIIFTKGGK